MSLDGLDDVNRRLLEAFERGIVEAADELKRLSQNEVPVDQFDLMRSAKVSTDTTGSVVEAAVSYDTPYAARQHEERDWKHQDGRKAGYLGDPLRANSQRLQAHIANTVRGELGG